MEQVFLGRAVVVALLDAGVPEIIITNRTRLRAENIRESFGSKIKVFDWIKGASLDFRRNGIRMYVVVDGTDDDVASVLLEVQPGPAAGWI